MEINKLFAFVVGEGGILVDHQSTISSFLSLNMQIVIWAVKFMIIYDCVSYDLFFRENSNAKKNKEMISLDAT